MVWPRLDLRLRWVLRLDGSLHRSSKFGARYRIQRSCSMRSDWLLLLLPADKIGLCLPIPVQDSWIKLRGSRHLSSQFHWSPFGGCAFNCASAGSARSGIVSNSNCGYAGLRFRAFERIGYVMPGVEHRKLKNVAATA